MKELGDAKMKTKKQYEKALDRIFDSYDAFYFGNKYGEGTHEEEFNILSELEGEYVKNALLWIRHNYDCYYKNDFLGEDTPFHYLFTVISEVGE